MLQYEIPWERRCLAGKASACLSASDPAAQELLAAFSQALPAPASPREAAVDCREANSTPTERAI